MSRQYNFIYSKLVLRDDDFVGQIAYSLYKKEKVDFIRRYKEKHDGADPVEVDFAEFHEFSSTETMMETYRLRAEVTLQEFLNNSLEEAIAEAEAGIRANQISLLREVVNPIKPAGFWMGVWQNTVATFVFSALLALVILITAVSTEGFWDTMGKLFGKDIKDRPEQSVPVTPPPRR